MNVKQKKEYFKLNNHNKKVSIDNKGSLGYALSTAESLDLTGEDLVRICEGKVRVVSYHELKDYKNIEDLLQPHGAIILLYETNKNYGHYTALFYDSNNKLEFFDSYGFSPDSELKYAKYDNTPYLTNLLNAYNKPIVYNHKGLQKWSKEVNTCGRWTAARIRMKNLTPDEFTDLFNNKYYTPDFFITAITYLYTFDK